MVSRLLTVRGWSLIAAAGLLPSAGLAAPQPALADRVQLVETGLLPITATKGHLGAHASIADRMRAYGVEGLSVAVIDGGRIAWAKGYGFAHAGTRRPVTPETLFQAASISKPVTTVGALLLVEHGKVGLDADVNRYLREWKISANALTATHPVTLRTLLDHSSGITDYAGPNYKPGESVPTLLQTLRAHAAEIRVASVPGKEYRYSGMGFVVLQELMEEVTGKPLATYMQSAVLAPLGMTHSTFEEPLSRRWLRFAATGYYAGGEPLPGDYRLGPELAVAGLWTTPSDLARFIITLQEAYAGGRCGLLTPEMARQMLSVQIAYRGLGVVLSGDGDDTRFGHDGFNEGFESTFAAYVHHGQGAVVMANSGFSYMLIKEIIASIARAYRWPHYQATNQWPPTAKIAQQEVTAMPQDMLSAAAGEYTLGDHTRITLFARGDRLFLRWPGNGDAEVFHTPDGSYFCPPLTFWELGDPRLRFLLDASGKVQEIIASYGAATLTRALTTP
ncbi:MAG: serine hydrolase domain-containing protein [Steroidobacteraceae bacterium]